MHRILTFRHVLQGFIIIGPRNGSVCQIVYKKACSINESYVVITRQVL